MFLPLSGTATVTNGDDEIVVAGMVLSKLNCRAGATIMLDGVGYFVAAPPTDTSHLTLTRPYAGANGSAVVVELQQFTADQVSIAALNKQTSTFVQQLSVLDANGRGLFYNLIGVTGANDPGPGNLAFDNEDPALVTELYFDVLDANDGGRDVSGLIGLWEAGTVLIVRSLASAAYVALKVTAGAVDAGGWFRISVEAVTPTDPSSALASEPVAVEWRLAGADKDTDETVNTLPQRAAFDAQLPGFRVTVNDVGDGRAARYTRLTSTAGVWSAPAYVTGPQGAASTVPGPTGPGTTPRGAYAAGTTYAVNDLATFNGSTFRKLTNAAAGTAPSSASPPVDTIAWEVWARKGTDGTGTGDVVGPSSSVVGRPAVFADASGKNLAVGPAMGPNDSLFALEIADLKGVRMGMSGGIADPFDDQSGVNTVASTNKVYDATNGWYRPADDAQASVAPSTTAGVSGFTIINRDVVLTNGKTVRSFVFTQSVAGTYLVKIAQRTGAGAYTIVYSQSVVHSGGGTQTFALTTPYAVPGSGTFHVGAYTASGSPQLILASSRAFKTGDLSGAQTGVTEDANQSYAIGVIYGLLPMYLASLAYTAASVPTRARIAVQVIENETITVNTDLVAKVSRDGASNTTTAVLVLVSVTGNVKLYEASEIDITAQSSASTMVWIVQTANGKSISVSGVVFQWR